MTSIRTWNKAYVLGRPASTGWSASQVPVEEGDYLRVGVEAVLQLGEAMALVLVEEVLDRTTVALHALDDLFRLPDGNARVVLAMDDHERGRDVPGPVDWAYGREELAVSLQRAVLGLAQGAAVAARVL